MHGLLDMSRTNQARVSVKGEEGYPSNGRVAWAAWGGDAGQTWARSKSNSIKKARERTMSETKKQTKVVEERAAPDALKTGDFVSWSSSGGTARGKISRIVRDGSRLMYLILHLLLQEQQMTLLLDYSV